jgi:outer membrane protein assembly factor BamB
MTKLFELKNNGINMDVSGNFVYIRNGLYLLKYDLVTLKEKAAAQIFKKDGKARSLYICDNKIFLRDFCDMYEISCKTLEVLRTWKLGKDLSSDISTETGDKDAVYACIRHGKITVIDLKTGKAKQHNITDSSSWGVNIDDQFVYVGCTNGELIILNKSNMKIAKRKQLHKKNIYSLLIHKNILYTTSQDTSLIATDLTTFETIHEVKKAVSNMERILGIHKKYLITFHPNRNAITVWDINNFCSVQTIDFPVGGLNSKGIVMKDHIIYGSDNDGVYKMDIKELL